jgi:dTDP-D-glucose 4,6-dehydratase
LGVTSSKAETLLGWRANWDIETALAQTVDWYRAMLGRRNMLAVTRSQVAQAIPTEPEELLLGSAG